MRDNVIRTSLHNTYLNNFWEDGASLVVDELPICAGSSVADMAVVNGSLHAYEIKGTFDSLARLPKQIADYSKVFDYVTVVTTQNHLNGVMSLIPENCGVWLMREIDGEILKEVIREPSQNEFKEALSICQLLWKEEAFSLLQKYNKHKGFSNKRKWLLWEALANSLTINDLSIETRSIIKQRVGWKTSRFRA